MHTHSGTTFQIEFWLRRWRPHFNFSRFLNKFVAPIFILWSRRLPLFWRSVLTFPWGLKTDWFSCLHSYLIAWVAFWSCLVLHLPFPPIGVYTVKHVYNRLNWDGQLEPCTTDVRFTTGMVRALHHKCQVYNWNGQLHHRCQVYNWNGQSLTPQMSDSQPKWSVRTSHHIRFATGMVG